MSGRAAAPTSPVSVIVLASGEGRRFRQSGGATHKLDARIGRLTVLDRVLDTVRASGLPHCLVREPGGTSGMGRSIAMGVAATPDASGWLVLPADLPLVRPGSLRRVAASLGTHAVVVPHHRGRRGHPVGFRHECFPALSGLDGKGGAASVVAAFRSANDVLDLELNDPGLVRDVDTIDDLRRARRLLLLGRFGRMRRVTTRRDSPVSP